MKKQILFLAALLMGTSMLFATVTVNGCDDCTPETVKPCNDCSIDQIEVPDVACLTCDAERSVIVQIGEGNTADVIQISSGFGEHNWSEVYSRGNDNNVYVRQYGHKNVSDINQIGNGNDGRVFQGTYSTPDKENYAKQQVRGNDNFAQVNQTGNGNASFQFQNGDDDKAWVNQNNTDCDVDDGNYAEQHQDAGSGTDYHVGSEARITQDGKGNAAKQTQTGSNNSARVTQIGKENTSVELQTSDSGNSSNRGNSSTVYQYGDYNLSCVTQHFVGDLNLMNTSNVKQYGDDNYSKVYQSGAGNSAIVYQKN